MSDPIRAKLDDDSPKGAWAEDCYDALRAVLDLCDEQDAMELNGPMIYRSSVRRRIAQALGVRLEDE